MGKKIMKKKKNEVRSSSKVGKNQPAKSDGEKSPPAVITETVGNVKNKYRYLKTVNSMDELDDFRFQHGCKFGNAKRNIKKFTRAILPCSRRSKVGGMCPYSLLVRRSHPKSSDIHVYAHSEHNHPLKPEGERAVYRIPSRVLVPDADPPTSLTTPVDRKWTFLRTVRDQKKMDKFRLKHHCRLQTNRGDDYARISMNCFKGTGKCQFRLLALKTERHRFHMYEHGWHTCCHADDNKNTESEKARNVREESRRIQEEEQLDVAEQSAGEMEEQMDQEETAENISPSTSKSGDIEEEQKQWPIEKIKRRLARALRKENADKVIKWMARTRPEEIGEVLDGLDIEQVVELLEIARKAIRGTDKENVSIWLGWIKIALASRGLELAEVPNLVDGLLSRILRRIERRELLPRRKLKTFRKRLEAMREHMQQKSAVPGLDS